jgi:hypothetical protein
LASNALKVGNVIKLTILGDCNIVDSGHTLFFIVYTNTTSYTFEITGAVLTDEPFKFEQISTIRSVGSTGKVSHFIHLKIGTNEFMKVLEEETINTTGQLDIAYINYYFSNYNAGNNLNATQSFIEYKN